MHKDKPKLKIAIVGAGPAGTSLAIRLAKNNFAVTLVEREKFPRHKLCGEFISPECLEHFRELGVLDEMLIRGGDRISQTIFYSENGKNVSVPSEWFGGSRKGALGLSRAEMDFRLMKKAKSLGVEVLEENQVVGLLFENEKVCGIRLKNSNGENKEIYSDLTIDATGRAKVLSKMAGKEKERIREKRGIIKSPKAGTRNSLVGFKAHLRNVEMPKGRCEIYFFRGGYGGLSYVEDGVANHCFLIKAEIVKEFKGDVNKILNKVIFKNERARAMMESSENVFDWLAVSVDGFGTKDLNPAENLLTVGDASAFIDPFTGSGMLMALESADILSEIITENHFSLNEIPKVYKTLHKSKFQKRLRVCSVMRRLSFTPNFAKIAISLLSLSRKSREILVHSTRKAEVGK